MDLDKDSGCFVCGQENSTGLQAVFNWDQENLRSCCRLTLDERFQGWEGVVHGGVIASLLDEACVYAGRSLAETLVTAELSVRYRKPVPVGREVAVHGEVLEQRRKVLKVRAKLEVDGELHVEANARIFLLD